MVIANMNQPGFFDLTERHKKLDEKDPLTHLNELIDWEDFIPILQVARPPGKTKGRPAFNALLMFKTLILQSLYNISDDQLEFQIRDRYSFCRFLNLMPEDRVPDAKTIWLFREQLTKAEIIKDLFNDFDAQLHSNGFVARKGQIMDASFVEAPRQRNTKAENEAIKNGDVPDSFKDNPNQARQKDLDARWAKKNEETHYGYKNHISVDNQHKFIRAYEVTSAEVHDSHVFDDLVSFNSSKDIWADSIYSTKERDADLAIMGYRNQIHKKGKRNKPLSEKQQEMNRKKSKVRARVEHVFGSIHNEQGGLTIKVIGLARTKTKVGLINLTYNMRRFVSLSRINASIAIG